VVRAGAYSTLALGKRLRDCRLSPVDKRLATELFYGALEKRVAISYLLDQFLKSQPEATIQDVLHIAAYQILYMDRVPARAACDEAVKQAKALGYDQLSGFVNGVLRGLSRAKEEGAIRYPDESDKLLKLSVECSVPLPLLARLVAAFGEDEALKLLTPSRAARDMSVRPNLMRFEDQQFEAYLERRKIAFTRGIAPHSYRVRGAGALINDADFLGGLFTIQGEGAMLAALATGARAGMEILDACAAPGGKSALLAEMMRGSGRVRAWDIAEHRVALISATAKRMRLDNIRPALRDAAEARDEFTARFDAVLLDVPCSGLGVMHDKPDIKLNFRDEEVASLVKLQRDIIGACCGYVRPGGLLVYATCTMLPEENSGQVGAFLEAHPEFQPDCGDDWLPEALRARFVNGMIQLLPHIDGTEGFFIARMRRRL